MKKKWQLTLCVAVLAVTAICVLHSLGLDVKNTYYYQTIGGSLAVDNAERKMLGLADNKIIFRVYNLPIYATFCEYNSAEDALANVDFEITYGVYDTMDNMCIYSENGQELSRRSFFDGNGKFEIYLLTDSVSRMFEEGTVVDAVYVFHDTVDKAVWLFVYETNSEPFYLIWGIGGLFVSLDGLVDPYLFSYDNFLEYCNFGLHMQDPHVQYDDWTVQKKLRPWLLPCNGRIDFDVSIPDLFE